jgi:hypothetical protein
MNRFLARSALVLSLAFMGCSGDDKNPIGPEDEGTLLTSGVAVANISGGTNLYRIPVTTGATRLTVTTAGGTGDADLWVRFGAPPTPISNDECNSIGDDNNETCVQEPPAVGTWYIMVVPGNSNYSGVTLTATVTRP